MSLISVVISHRHSLAQLQASVRSVLQQRADIELLVLDAHPPGDSEQCLESLESPLVRIPVRTGEAKAFNLAIERARGESLKFMFAGDELAAGCLLEQQRLLHAEQTDVCYADHQFFEQDSEGTRRFDARCTNHLPNPILDLLTHAPPLVCMLFSRSVVQRAGGFNESVEPLFGSRFAFDCADNGARFVRAQALGAFMPQPTEPSDVLGLRRAQARNLGQIMDRWLGRAQLDDAKRRALGLAMVELARFSARHEPEIFRDVSQRYQSLGGNFIPNSPLRMRVAATVLGYPNAERWLRIAQPASSLK